MTDRMLHYHDYHVPDDVCIFAVPFAAIRRHDHRALVYDVQFDADVLRHYAFSDRWFTVNCSLAHDGRFVSEPGPIAWTFNCDIATPLTWHNGAAYHVDLALDVLVSADGREHIVVDEDDFAAAVDHDWFTPAEQTGARRGLADLLAIITNDGLLPFLEAICPFPSIPDAPAQPVPTHKTLAEIPLLHPTTRDRLHTP